MNEWKCFRNGLTVCNRYGQRRVKLQWRDSDLHMVRALIGYRALLQACIGIVLLGAIHAGHIVECHCRLRVRRLARLRREQGLRKQEHQNDEPC